MKKLSFIIMVVILITALNGCKRPLQRISPPVDENGYLQDQKPEEVEKAEGLQDLVNDITGVEDAVVVIKGDEVYVGISDKNHTSLPQLKEKINTTLKQQSQYTKIYITDEADSVNTLRHIKNELLRGVNVETFRQELNDIRDLIML